MYILNPDPYILPDYRIKPFSNSDISFNHTLKDDDFIDDYFSDRYPGKKYVYTYNGRSAIGLALKYYNLNPGDIVTILTTTGNLYISHVVTDEIDKFCKWSRQIEPNTKVILVNHEFGHPYENLKELRQYGLPIIEDQAYSFYSHDLNDTIGTIGDFVIHSFSKFFPIQVGGLLVNNIDAKLPEPDKMNYEITRYIKNVLSFHIRKMNKDCQQRRENYSYLSELLKPLGFNDRFGVSERVVPSVFMFTRGEREIDLKELKKHCWAYGIYSSVFYGEEGYFLPVHQNLNKYDLEYFLEVIKEFLKTSDC